MHRGLPFTLPAPPGSHESRQRATAYRQRKQGYGWCSLPIIDLLGNEHTLHRSAQQTGVAASPAQHGPQGFSRIRRLPRVRGSVMGKRHLCSGAGWPRSPRTQVPPSRVLGSVGGDGCGKNQGRAGLWRSRRDSWHNPSIAHLPWSSHLRICALSCPATSRSRFCSCRSSPFDSRPRRASSRSTSASKAPSNAQTS